jgi:hypothetical protein
VIVCTLQVCADRVLVLLLAAGHSRQAAGTAQQL